MNINRSLCHSKPLPLFTRVVGDWTCACGFSNFASRAICFQCHRSRSVAQHLSAEGAATASRRSEFKNGDWMCACGAHNFGKRKLCVSCNVPRQQESSFSKLAKGRRLLPGDWICEKCHTHNFRSRKECMQCGNEPSTSVRSGADSSAEVKQSLWTCMTCHTVNENHVLTCEVCGAHYPEKLTDSTRPLARPDDWLCNKCGFLNFSSRVRCKNCAAASLSVNQTSDPSLWICECGYKNFMDRRSCRDCGASKATEAE